MKKLLSILLLLALVLSVSAAASAEDNPLARYSDEELRQFYEAVREEMIARGLPLAQEVTLKENGEDEVLSVPSARVDSALFSVFPF